MILIVGLGNPEPEYAGTRHNLGVECVKPLAEKFENKFDSLVASMPGGILVALPQTYMNESGRAVAAIKNFYKIPTENIWVVHDEVDLPLGSIRVNLNASSAGHRGVQSIIDAISSQVFWRIRLGVGKHPTIPTDAYVLQKFSPKETLSLAKIRGHVGRLIAWALEHGMEEGTYST